MGVSSSFIFGVMFPQPRMWLRVGLVQFLSLSGQVCFTRFHIVVFAVVGHSVRICCRDSIVFSQLVHFACDS